MVPKSLPRKTPGGELPYGKFPLFKLRRRKLSSCFNMVSVFHSGFSRNKPLVWCGCCKDWWSVFYDSCFLCIAYIQISATFLISFFIVEKEIKKLKICVSAFRCLKTKHHISGFYCWKNKWAFGYKMRLPKRPIVFLFAVKCEILQLYPNGYSFFFTPKYKILQMHPNGHSFFHNETQNFEICTQTAIRFLQQNR